MISIAIGGAALIIFLAGICAWGDYVWPYSQNINQYPVATEWTGRTAHIERIALKLDGLSNEQVAMLRTEEEAKSSLCPATTSIYDVKVVAETTKLVTYTAAVHCN